MADETQKDDTVEVDGELIYCVSCGVTFLFGGGERDYFKSKELRNPKRCAPCRRARREGRQYEMPEEIEDPEEQESMREYET